MVKGEQLWVAKLDMTMAGRKVNKGQIVKPSGSAHDHVLFGENTRWTYRYDGADPLECGTDGCDAVFTSLGLLDRHRSLIHAPERDERAKAAVADRKAAARAEERGDTIGGHAVVAEKHGPRGAVLTSLL